ncbi:hydrolase [Streptomyces sp. SA15]|nr:hydrolase [Streptomyces sp. SA15]
MISDVVSVPADRRTLPGDFVVPQSARAVVLFAHGLHTPRSHPRIHAVCAELHQAGIGTLSLDLFSEMEGPRVDAAQDQPVDMEMLGRRLTAAVDWLKIQPDTRALPVILFAAGAEAAVALRTAAELPDRVLTVVSWAGQPELAGDALERVRVPVLFITGSQSPQELRTAQDAARRLAAPSSLREVRAASHQFDEPDALNQAAEVTQGWIDDRLRSL